MCDIMPMESINPPKKRRQRRGKIDPEVIEREHQVLKLRLEGLTFDQVAQRIGYANPSSAAAAYKRAMKRTLQPASDELREIQLSRLEFALSAIWDKIEDGDLKAVDRLISISRRQSELLGLDAPKESKLEVTTYDGNILRERARQIIQIVRDHSSTESGMGSGLSQT